MCTIKKTDPTKGQEVKTIQICSLLYLHHLRLVTIVKKVQYQSDLQQKEETGDDRFGRKYFTKGNSVTSSFSV